MGAQLNGGSSRNSGGRGGHRPMSEINVTPFVDVMLVLLVVFMVAAPLLSAGVEINLPDSEASALTDEDNKAIQLFIKKDGQIFIGETKIKEGALLTILGAQTNNDPDRRIYINADEALDYGQVMKVLGSINGAGFRKVALISDPAQ